MTAITASFPAYHPAGVALHAAVQAPALPAGMRQLSMYELEYVAGSGLINAAWKAFCAGFTLLTSMVSGPAALIVGTFMSWLPVEDWVMADRNHTF
jgi:hypothetical protein